MNGIVTETNMNHDVFSPTMTTTNTLHYSCISHTDILSLWTGCIMLFARRYRG